MTNSFLIILKSMMKNFSFLTFVVAISCTLTGWTFRSDVKYPFEVETALNKAGANRTELEKALRYFIEKDDQQMLQALYFLISNMDIHYTETYVLKDTLGNSLPFREFDYPDIASAVAAIDSMHAFYGGLVFKDTIIEDLKSLKGKYLIDNVNQAFEVWRNSHFKDIPFEDFCEYILPYRVTVEPLEAWRETYRQKYRWMTDSLQNKLLERVLEYAGMDYHLWFTSSYGRKPLIEDEPLSRLSALQLLFRKRGACEDIAALQVFSLRSQGIPAAYDVVPWWATSMGSHFVNTVFDKQMQPIRLDVTNNAVVNRNMNREPAKVLRTTYSKQPDVLATKVDWRDIPPCHLRTLNYKDVTPQWWESSDVTVGLSPDIPKTDIAYAYVFNWGRWRPAWWGEVRGDSVTFSNMPKGIVILPVYYKHGRVVQAGYPQVHAYNHELQLTPDTVHRRTVEIKQQDGYLIFRPGKEYELFYWDKVWKSLGTQIAEEGKTSIFFENAPDNALFRLIPEYSMDKERPFIIMQDGTRYWW